MAGGRFVVGLSDKDSGEDEWLVEYLHMYKFIHTIVNTV